MYTTSKSPAAMPYLAGLDGIRAIAILAVLLFHGGIRSMRGGFLGVDVFFVLSGYLITSLLLREQVLEGRIGLRSFYLRRARRLLPGLLAMLFVTLTCAAIFMRDVVGSTLSDLPWAAAGLSNWWFIFHKQSYFEAMGRPPLLRHTWSLAVEAQFYLVWPVALSALFPMIGRAGIRRLALTFAAVSAGALALVSMTMSAGSSHAYFGTDTHSVGLFLGAALAAWQVPRRLSGLTDWLGASALAGLIILFSVAGESSGVLYRIGFPLAGVLTVILIVAAVQPGGITGRWLGVKPLRWVGERSYSIYVWHWPIFQAARPGIDTAVQGIPAFLMRLALTAAAAELSYRFLETPFRRGAPRDLWLRARAWNPLTFRFAAAAAATLLLLATAGETSLIREAFASSKPPAQVRPVVTIPVTKPVSASSPSTEILQVPAMLLGDSVLLGASSALAEQVNVTETDALVGRQALELKRLAESLAKAEKLQPVMILNLGNNGTVEEPTLRAILEALKTCQRVVIVNARVPKDWQDDNNELMARVVPTYPNAVVADWRTASEGHREYFGPDGVHTNPTGAQAYTDVVVAALEAEPTPAKDAAASP